MTRWANAPIAIDCDVLEADGGTRTASITGASWPWSTLSPRWARCRSGRYPLRDSVAAVSVGIVDGSASVGSRLSSKTFDAAVDMNVVMTGGGQFVEIQGTGEEATFSDSELAALLALGRKGITELRSLQREALGDDWPFNR